MASHSHLSSLILLLLFLFCISPSFTSSSSLSSLESSSLDSFSSAAAASSSSSFSPPPPPPYSPRFSRDEKSGGDPLHANGGDPLEPNQSSISSQIFYPSGPPPVSEVALVQDASTREEMDEKADPEGMEILRRIYGSTYGMVLPRAYTKPIRNILCVGDSLTRGYTRHGTLFYPYTIRLEDLIEYYTQVTPMIDNYGLSGQMVEQMVQRIPGYLAAKNYNWVIILGGTNNVIAGTNPGTTVSMIFQLHALAHNRGAKTVAITIPEMASEMFFPELTRRRTFINDGIREYVRTHSSNTILVDLALYLPQNTLSEANRRIYWDDGVHLTPAGYNYLGYLIYWFLAPRL